MPYNRANTVLVGLDRAGVYPQRNSEEIQHQRIEQASI